MSRIRYLKPEFFKDDDLAALPFEARLFFAGLWCFADREGRLEDRPARLKVEIFPYDQVDIAEILNLLAAPKANGKPFILRYEVEGEHYIQILSWEKHQFIPKTERGSIIPDPPKNNKEYLKIFSDKKICKDKDRDKDRDKDLNTLAPSEKKKSLAADASHPKAAVISFNFKTRAWENILAADISGWSKAYPAVDLQTEIAKAAEWLLANPKQKKSNYRRFLNSWFSRTQDRGGNRPPSIISQPQVDPSLMDAAMDDLSQMGGVKKIQKWLAEIPRSAWPILRRRYIGAWRSDPKAAVNFDLAVSDFDAPKGEVPVKLNLSGIARMPKGV